MLDYLKGDQTIVEQSTKESMDVFQVLNSPKLGELYNCRWQEFLNKQNLNENRFPFINIGT